MNKDSSWDDIISNFKEGEEVSGVVSSHEPYGVYIDLGLRFPGFVDRINIEECEKTELSDYPKVGTEITGVILAFRDSMSRNVDWKEIVLDIRPSRFGASQ